MEYKDYYKILEVDKSAGADDIEKASRKLTRKYGADLNSGDKKAGERLKEVSEARAVLTDPEKRAKYDRLGASWRAYRQSGDQGEFDWSEWVTRSNAGGEDVDLSSTRTNRTGDFSGFYEAIFSGMEQPRTVPQPGQDYTQEIEITLEEAFGGTPRILRIGGRRIEVNIPKGADTGTKIRVRGEGGEGQAGGPKGDLYLEIKVVPHPVFERVGHDLHLELPVDLYTAVLGGEAIVAMLKGRVKLKIPPETQSGRTFRLKGQGMPHLKQPDTRGDLYAKVMIQVPENLTDEEIALFEELADIRGL
jgi:curved DNA-binding protein